MGILLSLLDHGCILKLDHVITLVKKHIPIPNFYKYEIIPNNELYEACLNDYFDNYGMTQEDIENMFLKTRKLEQVKLILKNRKSLLNEKCLENAVTLSNNDKILIYLVEEHNIKMTYKFLGLYYEHKK
jgi:hypothetical protein